MSFKKIVFLFIFSIFIEACGSRTTPEIRTGVYRLLSARLYHSGRYRDVQCKGNLQLRLERADSGLKLETIGETLCEAPQPASFVEKLGGPCVGRTLNFVRDGQSESFSSEAASLSCRDDVSPRALFLLSPAGAQSVRLTHSSPSDQSLRSEFLFESL